MIKLLIACMILGAALSIPNNLEGSQLVCQATAGQLYIRLSTRDYSVMGIQKLLNEPEKLKKDKELFLKLLNACDEIQIKEILPNATPVCQNALQQIIDTAQGIKTSFENEKLGELIDLSIMMTSISTDIKGKCTADDFPKLPKKDSNRRNLRIENYKPNDVQACIQSTESLFYQTQTIVSNLAALNATDAFDNIQNLIVTLPVIFNSCAFTKAADLVQENFPELCVASIDETADFTVDIYNHFNDTYYVLSRLPDLYLMSKLAIHNCPWLHQN